MAECVVYRLHPSPRHQEIGMEQSVARFMWIPLCKGSSSLQVFSQSSPSTISDPTTDRTSAVGWRGGVFTRGKTVEKKEKEKKQKADCIRFSFDKHNTA